MPAAPRLDRAAISLLHEDLARAPWTVDAVNQLLGPLAAAALLRSSRGPARRALAAPLASRAAAAVLTSLFVLADDEPRVRVEAALPALGVEGAAALGLVTAAGAAPDDPVRALVDLRPHALDGERDWWVASDLGEEAVGGTLPADHVLGVGGASNTLAQLTVRRRGGRTLDVGTGSGVQALHAAARGATVVASDTSARALAFAAFNAELAGLPSGRVDLRRGSLLDPVLPSEQFDQLVSNPPFVVTPRTGAVPGWEYRDGGLEGDEIVRRLVVGAGAVLAPGGSAQLLGNWEHRAGEGWRDRVGGWLEESGLDGWVVQREVTDPAEYAETWLRDGGVRPGRESDDLVAAWVDDFEARGVEAVGFGFVVLHAPGADIAGRARWRRVEEVTGPVRPGLGDHVAAVLRTRERLAATSDTELLAAHLRVADDVTSEQHWRPGESGPRAILLRQGGGLGRAVGVDAALAGVVGACDGEVALGALASAVAALLDLDAGAVVGAVVPRARDLVADGLLEVVE